MLESRSQADKCESSTPIIQRRHGTEEAKKTTPGYRYISILRSAADVRDDGRKITVEHTGL